MGIKGWQMGEVRPGTRAPKAQFETMCRECASRNGLFEEEGVRGKERASRGGIKL